MEEKELEIIEQSMHLFMRVGIKSATMDDVARNLGISKKTLYNYVKDKNDLVDRVLDYSCEKDQDRVDAICAMDLNAIDESFEISNYVFEHINELHPSIVYDLQKYHIQAWESFKKKKRDKINECYSKNMKKGIEEGLYREDLNIPIIVNIYNGRFDSIFDGELFPPEQFRAADIYIEMFRYHIRGIASEKGIKYLMEKMKKEKLRKK